MNANIQPLRPDIPFVDQDGKLSKEGYDFLYNLFKRVGGFINEGLDDLATAARLNSIPKNDYYVQWQRPGKIGKFTPSTGSFTYLNAGVGATPGTAALPSFYLGTDTTTGLYRVGSNNWGMSIAGTKLVDYSNTLVDITGSLQVSSQLKSTVATGTPPLVVSSITQVPNLFATTALTLNGGSSYPANATDLATVITLANSIKANNIAKGV